MSQINEEKHTWWGKIQWWEREEEGGKKLHHLHLSSQEKKNACQHLPTPDAYTCYAHSDLPSMACALPGTWLAPAGTTPPLTAAAAAWSRAVADLLLEVPLCDAWDPDLLRRSNKNQHAKNYSISLTYACSKAPAKKIYIYKNNNHRLQRSYWIHLWNPIPRILLEKLWSLTVVDIADKWWCVGLLWSSTIVHSQ